jgi:hypothetical protein
MLKKASWPPIHTDEPRMAGRPSALKDENASASPIEESMSCNVFSEQRGFAGREVLVFNRRPSVFISGLFYLGVFQRWFRTT